MQIDYISAIAGSGKTTHMVAKSVEDGRKGINTIICQPTISLCNATFGKISELGYKKVEVINSENEPDAMKKIKNIFETTPRKFGKIIIITHSRLLLLDYIQNKQNWNLWIDEELKVDHYWSHKLPVFHHIITDNITRNVENLSASLVEITAANKTKLKSLAKNQHNDAVVDAFFKDIANHIISPKYRSFALDTVVNQYLNNSNPTCELSIISMLQPSFLDGFRNVIMMSAFFEKTLTYKYWNLIGTKFNKLLVNNLADIHGQNDLLKIATTNS